MRREPMATALRTCCAERTGAMQPRQLACIGLGNGNHINHSTGVEFQLPFDFCRISNSIANIKMFIKFHLFSLPS